MDGHLRPDDYRALRLTLSDAGILEVRLGGVERPNVLDRVAHSELTRLWREADADPTVRVVLIRGASKDLSAGGDLAMIQQMIDDYAVRVAVMGEAGAIVRGILDFTKPIVSMLHGRCIGAGLVPALLADISIAANDAMIMDGHTRAGLVAGDHAVAIWPLLCGMAQAKYLLLLNDPLSGEEASRIGLVSQAVDASVLEDTTQSVAERLALAAPTAIQWTKHALNHWMRQALPAFEVSLALQYVGMAGPDAREGLSAIREKRTPQF